MVPFSVDLKGKTAAVTGGGGVLCSAFASALAECGASVAVLDLNKDAAEAVAETIRKNGGVLIAENENYREGRISQYYLIDLGYRGTRN